MNEAALGAVQVDIMTMKLNSANHVYWGYKKGFYNHKTGVLPLSFVLQLFAPPEALFLVCF